MAVNNVHVYQFAVHLLATTTNVTTNNIKVPYKMLYLDSKSVTCPFRACNYNIQDLYPTYDVDQSATSMYKHSIVLWLGKYHDIALW